MTEPSRLVCGALVLAFSALLFLHGLSEPPFYTKGEAREAIQVREAVEHGRWVLQIRNGDEYPSKPPMFHWSAAVASLVAGEVSETTVRFPSALYSILSIFIVFLAVARRWGARAALFSSLVLATNFEWIRASQIARVDMTLTAWLTLSFVCFERIARAERPSRWSLVGFYLGMAGATLAKGPIGIILPSAVGGTYLLIRRDLWRIWTHMHPFLGALVGIGVPLAWYVAATIEGGEGFFQKQILEENFARFFAAEEADMGHLHPWYYLLVGFGAGFAPWSVFLIPVGASLWRERGELDRRGWLYPIVWFAVVMAFYSASEAKRTVYVLSLYPAAAILLGTWWARVETGELEMPRSLAMLMRFASVGLAVVLGVAAVMLLGEAFGSPLLDPLRSVLHARDWDNVALLRPVLRERVAPLIVWTVAMVPILAVLIATVRRERWSWVLATIVGGVALTLVAISQVFHPALAARRTLEPFATRIAERFERGDAAGFGPGSFDYGVVFFSKRNYARLDEPPFPPSRAGRNSWLLIFEEDYERLDTPTRATLEIVDRSEGTGPKGRSRMLLTRVLPSAR